MPIIIVLVLFGYLFAGENTHEKIDAPTATALSWIAVMADNTPDNYLERREFAEKVLCKNPAWALPVIRENLNHEKINYRQTAIRLLGLLGEIDDEIKLLELANHTDFFNQNDASRALFDLYQRFPPELIALRLRQQFPIEISPIAMKKIREVAFYALFRQIKNNENKKLSPAILDALVEMLKELTPLNFAKGDDENAQILLGVLEVLKIADYENATTPFLLSLLEKENIRLLVEVCVVLRRSKLTNSLPQVELLTNSKIYEVALKATALLAALEKNGYAEKLRDLADDENYTGQATALELFAEISPQVDWLLRHCHSQNYAVKTTALNCLQNLPTIKTIDRARFAPIALLIKTDNQPEVRALAAQVMAQVDRPLAIAALRENVELTGAKNLSYRITAIKTLGELQASETLRLLSDCARDAEIQIALTAIKALAKIPESNHALFNAVSDNRERISLTARIILYDRTGIDPGSSKESREEWRRKFLP